MNGITRTSIHNPYAEPHAHHVLRELFRALARIDQLVTEAQELTGPDDTTQRSLGLLKEVQAAVEVAKRCRVRVGNKFLATHYANSAFLACKTSLQFCAMKVSRDRGERQFVRERATHAKLAPHGEPQSAKDRSCTRPSAVASREPGKLALRRPSHPFALAYKHSRDGLAIAFPNNVRNHERAHFCTELCNRNSVADPRNHRP
jgi:hypothetical protein